MSTAIVTASYRGDLERCRLLCESIDARVVGHSRHLILVEEADVALFASFAGPRREVVCERDLLPAWLRPFPDPLSLGRRRLWLSPFGPPLRGWHAQQLRRIAMAATMPEAVMLTLDSDVVFVKDFNVAELGTGDRVEFYRIPDGLSPTDPDLDRHRTWSRKAGEVLGIPAPPQTNTDYIAQMIAWRTASARAMTQRIEAVTGRSWVRALAGTRALSECTIYGRFVEEVEGRPELHRASTLRRCRTYWSGAALGEAELAAFVAELAAGQVAVGIQSFIGTDIQLIRRAAGLG